MSCTNQAIFMSSNLLRVNWKKYHPESKEYAMVKDLVSKYEKEQQEKAEAEKKERLQAVNKLRKKYDDIKPYYLV